MGFARSQGCGLRARARRQARPGSRPHYTALTQHSCYQPQSSGLDFAPVMHAVFDVGPDPIGRMTSTLALGRKRGFTRWSPLPWDAEVDGA